MGFLGGTVVKTHCQCRRRGFDPWDRKSPRRKKWQPIPVFLPKNSTDRGAWQATGRGVARVVHNLATKPPSNLFTDSTDNLNLQGC